MIDFDKLRSDFRDNNMSPYDLHKKYNVAIEIVYYELKKLNVIEEKKDESN
jgi:Zn-dependent peptidase ImmA (M78 family)